MHAAVRVLSSIGPRIGGWVLRAVEVGVAAHTLSDAWTLIADGTRRGAAALTCLGRRQTWSEGTHDEQRNDYGGKSADYRLVAS